MIRVIIENVLLFLLPTAMYLAYVLLTRRTTSASGVVNDAPLLWLFATGALLVAATLIYYGATSTGGRPDQTYTPPRMKDGRIEPGQLK
jgi:hypothetical protein